MKNETWGKYVAYCTRATKKLPGLILAESVGYEGLIFFGSVRNMGEFRGSP